MIKLQLCSVPSHLLLSSTYAQIYSQTSYRQKAWCYFDKVLNVLSVSVTVAYSCSSACKVTGVLIRVRNLEAIFVVIFDGR
jgi:hypothetical protein